MTQSNLFNEPVINPKMKCLYNKYDLVSMLIKSIRLGQKEAALKCYWILKQEGITEYYIAKKLLQFASEDAVTPEAVNFAFTTFQIIKEFKVEENSMQRLILYLCSTEKMWETEGEHYWELRRIQIREETKKLHKKGLKPLELPEYVYDVYTSTGKQKLKKGEHIDRRFSGVYEGSGLFMRASFLKWGECVPEYTEKTSAYAPHLLQCAEEHLSVDQYLRKYQVTIDQFLNIDAK